MTDDCVRVHSSFDSLTLDSWSIECLSAEVGLFYRDPQTVLGPLELSFRDYVLAEEGLRDTELYQRALTYWQERLTTLPPAPELPLARAASSLQQPHFVRKAAQLEKELWKRLKARANQAGLTPSGVLLAAFAEVLKVWSKSGRFTINLTLFNRMPLHAQVNDIVGDFTSLTLLEIDNSSKGTFEELGKRIQEQLWKGPGPSLCEWSARVAGNGQGAGRIAARGHAGGVHQYFGYNRRRKPCLRRKFYC